MQTENPVLAILCSDIHFTHTLPIARANEPDWYAAQLRYIEEIESISRMHDNVPILCAGDLFDKWNSPAELINFVLDSIRQKWYTIPGQHDTPYHAPGRLKDTAYWTCVMAQKFNHIKNGDSIFLFSDAHTPRLRVTACHWEMTIPPVPEKYRGRREDTLNVLLCHRYVWATDRNSYPGASESERVRGMAEVLSGYEVALFGDNHKSFLWKTGNCWVWNNGCVIPRKSDERDYGVNVGLLRFDGTVDIHKLDTSKDLWISNGTILKAAEENIVLQSDFIKILKEVETKRLDFRDLINVYTKKHDVPVPVSRILEDSLDR